DRDNGVENEDVKGMFPVPPLERGGKGGADDPQHGANLGHKLEGCTEERPERSTGNANDVQSHEPEKSNRERILKLGDEPVLQRSPSHAKVFANIDSHRFTGTDSRYMRCSRSSRRWILPQEDMANWEEP